MKVLIDMNLSPKLTQILKNHGIEAIHWKDVGSPEATDEEILFWAKKRGFIVITHDLDFGAILAATKTKAPSVVQIRTLNVAPEIIGPKLANLLKKFREILEQGALIVVDERKARVRILPLIFEGGPE